MRAWESTLQIMGLEAGEDLREHHYRWVIASGTSVVKPTAAGQLGLGVLQNHPPAHSVADFAYGGFSIALGDGTVDAEDRVAIGTNGLTRKAQSGDWIMGVAILGDGGVSGRRITVRVHPMGPESA